MHTYFSAVVLLHRGSQVTVEGVFCGEGYLERATQYQDSHPVQDGTYEVVEAEAEVIEHPSTWGLIP